MHVQQESPRRGYGAELWLSISFQANPLHLHAYENGQFKSNDFCCRLAPRWGAAGSRPPLAI